MDACGWTAHYNDGTKLDRYNEDESENSYGDIDREHLKSFEAWNDNGVKVHIFRERPSQKLVWRMRNFVNGLSGQMMPEQRIIILGWQEKIGGESYKHLNYIYPDGHIEFDGARNNLELYPNED